MKNYRVYAEMDDKKYSLCQTEYNDDRGQRFELFKNLEHFTIFPNKETANMAIEAHKRTRIDQKVESYTLVIID